MKRRQIKSLNTVSFMLCVIIIGFSSYQAVKIPRADISEIINGEVFRRMETHYQDVFSLKDMATGLWAMLNYTIFNEGRNGVVVGKDEWLFSVEEYHLSSDYRKIWNNNLQLIVQQVQQLKKKGLKVLVVLVPEKADLYRNKLSKETMHNSIGLYHHTFQALADQGIHVVNVKEALNKAIEQGDQVFFRTDTHWTIRGAQLAALETSRSKYITPGTDIFTQKYTDNTTMSGDLTKFIPTGEVFSRFAPRPDSMQQVSIDKEVDEMALFADIKQDTILIGTSYSADLRWKFADWLQYYFHKEVLNFSDEGTGPFQPMKKFIDNDLANEKDISFVIWEIPVRYLVMEPSTNETETH
ncbi:MAG TPA: hypothetical protein EYG88_11975 [Desulfocapsa sulfexigens]|nr:hypothetical protein [Desulfocapsa sulfexigens]